MVVNRILSRSAVAIIALTVAMITAYIFNTSVLEGLAAVMFASWVRNEGADVEKHMNIKEQSDG
jgi:hypothetical protein